MLKVEEVKFDYSEQSFSFDFKLNKGECLVVSGHSGSGKTTLLNLIAGFLKLKAGCISFDAQRIDQLSPAKRPLTILFQEHNLFNHLSVFQNIALGINPSLKLTTEQIRMIKQAINQVGLDSLSLRLPESLSGGQRQRVALARCLVRSRPLLLLDEPFGALNSELKAEIKALLLVLLKKLNLTILMVTHDSDDAHGLANKQMTIKDGKNSEISKI